ncbi:MAG: TolC family protein [Pseudomonadota bacterium]
MTPRPKTRALILTLAGACSIVEGTSAQLSDSPPISAANLDLLSPSPAQELANTDVSGGSADTIITQGALLESARTRYPEILALLAERSAASGKRQAALGAFDLFLESEAEGWLTGFYQGTSYASVGVSQRLRNTGGTIYGGYRVSEGDFPVYDDLNFTNTFGELKIGAVFALMRDRLIDADRFAVTDLALAEQQAATEIFLVELGVQRAALNAYWRWTASGEVVEVYRDLLETALARQSAFERQFEAGAIAEIALVENERVIMNREAQLASAERDLAIASNDLALFWRDEEGLMRAPRPDQRPLARELNAEDYTIVFSPADASVLGDSRPDLQFLSLGIQRARREVAFRTNDLRPKLDLNVELSRDFGEIAEGGVSRDSTDLVAGFKFSVPLGQNKARGALSAARAELRAEQLRRRLASEEVELEVRNILARLSTAFRLYIISGDEVDLAARMTRSERRLFENGASDLFRIIFREEDEARARVNFILTRRDALIAKADYDAATVNLSAFGLGSTSLPETP